MVSETTERVIRPKVFLRRFVGAYFVFFMFPLPFSGLPWVGDPLDTWVRSVWARAVPWLSLHVANVTIAATAFTGSGDRRLDYVRVVCCLALAAVSALLWSLIARPNDSEREWSLIWIYLRYALGTIMLFYGTMKLTLGQFSMPGAADLAQPLGEFSPPGLLWAFMGFSSAYQFFGGLAELVGAALLFYRRTTTMGALITAGVLANVVMLNFCFDVAVKVESFHYFIIALIIALPDVRGLFDFFVWRRPTTPAQPFVFFASRRGQCVRAALATVFLILPVATELLSELKYHGAVDTIALAGVWRVDAMSIAGQEVPPGVGRWSEVAMMPWFLRISRDDAPRFRRVLIADEHAQSFELKLWHGEGQPGDRWTWVRPDDAHATITGTFEGKRLHLQLRRLDMAHVPLVTHGFHWVNEVPGID